MMTIVGIVRINSVSCVSCFVRVDDTAVLMILYAKVEPHAEPRSPPKSQRTRDGASDSSGEARASLVAKTAQHQRAG